MPWKRVKFGENLTTTTLIEAVDSMIYDKEGEEQDMVSLFTLRLLTSERVGNDWYLYTISCRKRVKKEQNRRVPAQICEFYLI